MSDISIFSNPQFGRVRTSGTADEPLFCLADICKALDIQNVSDVKSRLQDGVVQIEVIDTIGRTQQATFVNEKNLYKVIMRSDKPQAEAFQDWVCGEVLPSIRKSGQYSIQPQGAEWLLAMAKQLVEQEKKQREQQLQIEDIKQRIDGEVEYSTIVGFATRHHINIPLRKAAMLGKTATSISKERGFECGKVNDPRFGSVRTYSNEVLRDVFRLYYPNVQL